MLSSCANGVVVVNIDNGYGAAMAAYRLLGASGARRPDGVAESVSSGS
jgi:NCAIR mutase (PurE)-related protein